MRTLQCDFKDDISAFSREYQAKKLIQLIDNL